MDGYKLNLTVSPWSGYSGVYVEDVMNRLELKIRQMLDDQIGYINANGERNYEIIREENWSSLS